MLEVELNIALINLLKKRRVQLEELAEASKLNVEILLELLEGLPLKLERGTVVVEDAALFLLSCWKRGIDPIRLALEAGWRDFEELCARILEEASYTTLRNLRFKRKGRSYEVDVVAFKKPRVLAVDCKKWRRFRSSLLKRAAESQKSRAEELADALRASHSLVGYVKGWNELRVYPVVVTLHEGRLKVHEGVPVVPLLKLAGFLRELEAYEDEVYVARRRIALDYYRGHSR